MKLPLEMLNRCPWKKAKKSQGNSNCVEVWAMSCGTRLVRDSKDPGGPVLIFTPGEWDAFIGAAKAGEFD